MRRAGMALAFVVLAFVLPSAPGIGAPPSLSGPSSVEFSENDDSIVGTYSVTNADAGNIAWSLQGDDMALFSVTGGKLAFIEPPNHENAKDNSGDNVYNVTVVATNEDNETGSVQVAVTVVDVNDPNVVLIMADDVGYESFGSYGSTQYSTPRLDALANLGVRFRHAYSNPSCTPSRVSIMTGRSNVRNYGLWGYLWPSEYTFADLFDDAGYRSVIAGKWQLHQAGGVSAASAGFDSYCLWSTSNTARPRYWNPSIDCNGTVETRTDQDYGPDIFTDHILSFIETNKDRPFFAYYPMVLPHSPFVAPPITTCPDDDDDQCNFEAMVSYLDRNVGRIYDKLVELDLLDNSILIFTSDNGTDQTLASRLGDRVIYGDKKLTTDGGTRVPMIVYVPDGSAGRVLDDLIDFSDMLPTLADAIGATIPESVSLDGVSFWDRLQGGAGTPREWIYSYYFPNPYTPNLDDPGSPPQIVNVRNHRYRLYGSGELFDVANDPLELHPIPEDDAATSAVRAELQGVLDTMPSRSEVITFANVPGDADSGLRPLWRPVLTSATIDGATLDLNYAGQLDTSYAPDPSAYTVLVDGESRSVTQVTVQAEKVTLTITPAVKLRQQVTVSYTPADANALRHHDRTSGHYAAPLDAQSVLNQSPPNGAPTFPGSETVVREVLENTPAGQDIGAPVQATDADEDDLTYSISGSDAVSFTVDQSSGQLRTKAPLDHETRPSYTLTVIATDEGNAQASREVTITVLDQDEPPTVRGNTTPNFSTGGTGAVASYRAVDPEDGPVSWWLSGLDSFAFEIVDGILRFQSPPDISLPIDVGGDNVYELTVNVDDASFNRGQLDVRVTVARRIVSPPVPPSIGGGGGGGGGPPPEPVPSDEDFDWNVTRDIEELDQDNDLPTGIWSDGQTLWILENAASGSDSVFAYELDAGERQQSLEFELHRRNRFSHGIWSDGGTVWIADSGQDQLFVYALDSGERNEALEFELAERNRDPRGIWSDGETIYVLDSVKDALFSYDLERGDLIAEFALDKLNKSPRGIWSDGVAIWISDDGAKRLFAYEFEDGALVRNEELEFSFRSLLKAGNGNPRGIWSNGDTMFVVDQQDDRVYSYNMPDATIAQLASLSLSGIDIGEFSAQRLNYQGAVELGISTTTVQAEASQELASVDIRPSAVDGDPDNGHQLRINGQTVIEITVRSADQSRSRTYRVLVEQPPCLSGLTDSRLSYVRFVGGSLSELEACARSQDVDALFHVGDRQWAGLFLLPGLPEFLSRPFNLRFAGGLQANELLVALRRATADAAIASNAN